MSPVLKAQNSALALETRYETLEDKIRDLKNHPQKVLSSIELYSQKAKLENSQERSYRAYVLGTLYAENRKKPAYADSMLITAAQIGQPHIMGDALMTNGMLHELNENYNVALSSYVNAQKNLSEKDTPYLSNVLNLNIARIRNYLGQNAEAKLLLLEALTFFRQNHGVVEHTDYRDYYMHSLIALLDTQSKLGEFADNKKLVAEGISFIEDEKMPQFRPYFVGSEGIDAYYRKNYPLAISKLNHALTLYSDNWKHLTEKFYLGMSYYKAGKHPEALKYLTMLDEEFRKTGKIDPQFRPAFETLYEYHKNTGNVQKQLEYVNKLLQINTLYEKNYKELFQQLSSRYDNKLLQEEKEQLQNRLVSDRIQSGIISGVSLLIACVSIFIALRYYRRRNYYKKLYEEFSAIPQADAPGREAEQTAKPNEAEADEPQTEGLHETVPASVVEEKEFEPEETVPVQSDIKSAGDLNPLLVEQIVDKLHHFEQEKGYMKKNLTLTALASRCGTNSTYLSKVLNQNMGQSFNAYLNTLRLNEVIHMWKSRPKTRQLSIQETANKLGYSTAQSFSKNFQERYHISPTYFLKRLNDDEPI
ncbi:helix-turn-helix domain-containing protein [Chryseobacterium sp. cx-311]|uniref:helix-turn-helix transcriptional regulator n=1 Tax=Marnyiella aurantia TaxID=2758037 RepID=UPI001AE4F862|nr:helix-turn-helix transcriptional regulator [Marnyiella aurantia]MBP0612963.1 helix-turn-helix domain-containing protein [Marnyiella aurantia]